MSFYGSMGDLVRELQEWRKVATLYMRLRFGDDAIERLLRSDTNKETTPDESSDTGN